MREITEEEADDWHTEHGDLTPAQVAVQHDEDMADEASE